MRQSILPAFAVAVLVASCGTTDPHWEFSHAWMVNGCSPVDGRAVELYLAEATPNDVSQPTYPHIRVAIDVSIYAISGRRFSLTDDQHAVYMAQHCIDSSNCTPASHVTVEFELAEDSENVYTGDLEMEFTDGTLIQRSFRAPVYSLLMLCG